MTVRWHLADPATGDSYDFEVNPQPSGPAGNVGRSAGIGDAGWSDDGPFLVRGHDAARTSGFTLTVLTATAYTQLWEWYWKAVPVQITDHLGRTVRAMFTALTANRTRHATAAWFHEITCTYVVLDPAGA